MMINKGENMKETKINVAGNEITIQELDFSDMEDGVPKIVVEKETVYLIPRITNNVDDIFATKVDMNVSVISSKSGVEYIVFNNVASILHRQVIAAVREYFGI